jgi:competence ComEA-like helix-hairpin-helix protein
VAPALLLVFSALLPGQTQGSVVEKLLDINHAGLLDLNRAGVEELDRLPGIGPARAAAIVRIRERNGLFRSVEELRALPRLSEKQFEELRKHIIVVQPASPDGPRSGNSQSR